MLLRLELLPGCHLHVIFFPWWKGLLSMSVNHTFLLWTIVVAVLAAAGQGLHSVPVTWSAKGLMMCHFLPSGALHAASLTFPSPANPRGKWLKTEPAPTEADGEMPADFSGGWTRLQERNWMLLIVGSRPRCWCPSGLLFSVSSALWLFHLCVGCWKDSGKCKLNWLSLVRQGCEQLYVRVYIRMYISSYMCIYTETQPLLATALFIFLSPKLTRIHQMVLKSLKEISLVKYLPSSECSRIGKSS